MPHVSPETFRAALRDLSDDEFAAFVAAVFRARGHDARVTPAHDDHLAVAIDDRTLLVYRPDRFDRFLSRRPALGDADGVVTDAGGLDADCEVVGPERLREQTLFGVDRADRLKLLDRLAVSPATPAPAERPQGLAGVRRSHLIVAAVAFALVVVALVGFPGGAQQGTNGSEASSFEDRVTVFQPQGTLPTTTTATATTTTSTPSSISDRYPPGIDENGIESDKSIARSHARTLSRTSYRLEIVRREFVDGNLTGFRREVTYVAGPTRLYSTLNRTGRFRGRIFVTDDREIYANGTTGYVRYNSSVRRMDLSESRSDYDSDVIADYVGGVVHLLLPPDSSRGVEEFSRNGTRMFGLRFASNASLGQHNVSGYAVVDGDGVVRELRRRWERKGTNLTVVVTMRVDRRSVTVTPPAWVRAYRERTANATNATTTAAVIPGLGLLGALPADGAPLIQTAPGRDLPGLREASRARSSVPLPATGPFLGPTSPGALPA